MKGVEYDGKNFTIEIPYSEALTDAQMDFDMLVGEIAREYGLRQEQMEKLYELSYRIKDASMDVALLRGYECGVIGIENMMLEKPTE